MLLDELKCTVLSNDVWNDIERYDDEWSTIKRFANASAEGGLVKSSGAVQALLACGLHKTNSVAMLALRFYFASNKIIDVRTVI